MTELEQTLQIARDVVHRGEPLVSVAVFVDPELPSRPEKVLFRFASGNLCVAVDGRDDTVLITVETDSADDASSAAHASEGDPIQAVVAPALGCALQWVWTFVNHQGYVDGVQIEFASARGQAPVCLQLIAAASAFDVRQVTPLRAST